MTRHPDILSGAVIVALGAALGVVSLYINVNPAQPTLTARFVPLLIAGVLVVCGLVIIFRGARLTPAPMPFLFTGKLFVMATLLLVYFSTFAFIDFRVGAWAMMLSGMILLGNRNVAQLVILPVIVAVTVYVIFRYVFTIVLPVWI